MKNPLSKLPFLFLLLPLVSGILLQYIVQIQYLSIALFALGITAMLFSFFITESKQFSLRWLYGVGVLFFVMGIGIISTSFQQKRSAFIFSNQEKIYKAVVMDSPQEKKRSVAYKVQLLGSNKQIICYLPKDSVNNNKLDIGDVFLFYGKIQPFANSLNPDDFDYARYMYNQGFSGVLYLHPSKWKQTQEKYFSLPIRALQLRQHILNFYRSLDFDDTEYAVLSALTLGYQDDLTDELKQGFRTTGTVHVLSVSGLHVGIIYIMIHFLLGFIPKRSHYYWIKPLSIILLLWLYAFITGLPPSVIRASAMLSILCLSEIVGRKNLPKHSLYIAAFFILLYNPMTLFDIGFQLSFMSVFSILYLHPVLLGMLNIKNKYLRRLWQLFTLSLVAQLATFPLCLYYFGTFPTYFFITNLLIVPLVSLITYSVAAIASAKILSLLLPSFSCYFYYLPVMGLKLLVGLMTRLINFFEQLPFALISEIKISSTVLIFLYLITISFSVVFIYKKYRFSIVGLSVLLCLIIVHIHSSLSIRANSFTIYNRYQKTDIRWNRSEREFSIGNTIDNHCRLLELGENKVLLLSRNIWNNKTTNNKLKLNYLVLINDPTFSIAELSEIIYFKKVIFDSSLSTQTIKQLTKECQKLDIPYHDVRQKGAYSFIF